MSGLIASALVFSTFCMKTMMPLRYIAICSNVAFIIYGILGTLYPILILHSVLAPLNAYRLWQMKKLIKDVAEAAKGDMSVDWLLPYMTKRHAPKGEVLFRKGDPAHDMYYIVRGTIRLTEIGVERGVGNMIGEIGIFSPRQERISSAECVTQCELLTITRQKVLELYYQNPNFGYYLVRLIAGRLIEEVDRLEQARS
ncbi:MAG: Crp/Fnr family transcriptional regulator [Gammaproteobacteria bacterium]